MHGEIVRFQRKSVYGVVFSSIEVAGFLKLLSIVVYDRHNIVQ